MRFKIQVETPTGPKWVMFDKDTNLRAGLTTDEERATEFDDQHQRDRALAALTRIGTPLSNPREVELS